VNTRHAETRTLTVVRPHGFCSGVARAVRTAEAALESAPGESLYCLNEIVHNRIVVEDLARRGVAFVTSLTDVPCGARVMFSAHGVSPAVRAVARARALRVIDATCPFVAKVHGEVVRFAAEGYTVFCIGHRNHDEVVGVAGEAPDHVIVVESEQDARQVLPSDPFRVAAVSQTTLGAEMLSGVLSVLRERFPALRLPDVTDVCYATINRQTAVRALATRVGFVVVLGSPASSNSRRLVEAAQSAGAQAVLVNALDELDHLDFAAHPQVGLTSGASTPESFLDAVIDRLVARHGYPQPTWYDAVEERTHAFALPSIG